MELERLFRDIACIEPPLQVKDRIWTIFQRLKTKEVNPNAKIVLQLQLDVLSPSYNSSQIDPIIQIMTILSSSTLSIVSSTTTRLIKHLKLDGSDARKVKTSGSLQDIFLTTWSRSVSCVRNVRYLEDWELLYVVRLYRQFKVQKSRLVLGSVHGRSMESQNTF